MKLSGEVVLRDKRRGIVFALSPIPGGSETIENAIYEFVAQAMHRGQAGRLVESVYFGHDKMRAWGLPITDPFWWSGWEVPDVDAVPSIIEVEFTEVSP